MDTDCQIECISIADMPDDYRVVWRDIQAKHEPLQHPCLTFEYNLLCQQSGSAVEVAIIKSGGSPVGFLPFSRISQNRATAVALPFADMNAMVALPQLQCSIDELMRSCGLDTYSFDHLVTSQYQFEKYHAYVDDSFFMDLSGGYESYINALQQRKRKWFTQICRKSRKIERELGDIRFEFSTQESSALDCLRKWKSQKLRSKDYYDMFELAWLDNLISKVAKANFEQFSGCLSVLFAGETLVAVHLGMRSGSLLSSWIPAHNPAFERYSPGVLLHLELARHAEKQGITRVDLGRGSNPLKDTLKSGSVQLAVGDVELRRFRRFLTACKYYIRELVYAHNLHGTPLKLIRKLRNALRKYH